MAKKTSGPKGSSMRLKPKNSNDSKRVNAVGKDGMRSSSTVKRLAMYNTKAKRDKSGKIVSEELQSRDLPNTRIVPDRRWFGNTRVIGQKQLSAFREDMATKTRDPFTVILSEKKLPMSLIEDPDKAARAAGRVARANLVAVAPFADTFGKRQRRKRPSLPAESYAGLLDRVATVEQDYETKDRDRDAAPRAGDAPGAWAPGPDDARAAAREPLFDKGQSKRIWGELYKVLDSSDVVLQVLDARDPMGTRSTYLEQHLRKNARQKQLILIMNKCDLVPAWVTKRWLHVLSREYPTLAFHASITSPFGKGSLLGLLRQLSRLRSDKKYISVGLVGYPNVGKSSVINALRSKRVCSVAPVPGATKVWQYITLTKKIFLIDCPGVVHAGTNKDTDTQAVLKGVVRVENLEDATEHVGEVLRRVKKAYVQRAYRIPDWDDVEDFLAKLARSTGRLLRGGEPDYNSTAKMVLFDWQRGRIPFFTTPPDHIDDEDESGAAGATTEDGAAGGGDAEEADGDAPTADATGTEAERAEAAKRALAADAAAATRHQARGAIPVAEGFFDDEDVHGGESDEEDEAGSPVSSGGSSPVVSDDEDVDGSDEDEGEDGSDASSSSSSGEDEEAAEGGYGKGGLSWEAIMEAMENFDSADKIEGDDTASAKGRKGGAKGRASNAKAVSTATPGTKGSVPKGKAAAAPRTKKGALATKNGVSKPRRGA